MTQLVWARNTLLFSWCLAGVLQGAVPPLRAQTTIAQLKTQFEHPPDDSRPMMRWWWFGVAAEKPEIRRELEQMKADGIGGAELAFVYPQVVDDPAKHLVNEPFLSSSMLEDVSYAAREARGSWSSPGRYARQRLALRRARRRPLQTQPDAFAFLSLRSRREQPSRQGSNWRMENR